MWNKRWSYHLQWSCRKTIGLKLQLKTKNQFWISKLIWISLLLQFGKEKQANQWLQEAEIQIGYWERVWSSGKGWVEDQTLLPSLRRCQNRKTPEYKIKQTTEKAQVYGRICPEWGLGLSQVISLRRREMGVRARYLCLRKGLWTMLEAPSQKDSGSASLRASAASTAVGIQHQQWLKQKLAFRITSSILRWFIWQSTDRYFPSTVEPRRW